MKLEKSDPLFLQAPRRCVISGSRDWEEFDHFYSRMDLYHQRWKDRVVYISGLARGPDKMLVEWAKANDKDWVEFPADWDKHGKKAGYLRNQEMADHSTHAFAFWDGKSRGTKHMLDTCLRQKIHVLLTLVGNPK
jgi:hypothetical protein